MLQFPSISPSHSAWTGAYWLYDDFNWLFEFSSATICVQMYMKLIFIENMNLCLPKNSECYVYSFMHLISHRSGLIHYTISFNNSMMVEIILLSIWSIHLSNRFLGKHRLVWLLLHHFIFLFASCCELSDKSAVLCCLVAGSLLTKFLHRLRFVLCFWKYFSAPHKNTRKDKQLNPTAPGGEPRKRFSSFGILEHSLY